MSSTPPAFLNALQRLYQEGSTIVFWNDPDGEFGNQVNDLDLENVQIIRLDKTPSLQAKVWIERELGKRWLVYAPFDEPEPANDWLLDARLRGKAFNADTASMQLEELGLTTHALRDHLKLRAKFLRAKERIDRLKRWVQPGDTALDLDRKMIAVIIRADTADAASIFLKVFAGFLGEDADLGLPSKALEEIASYELQEAFWTIADDEFGFAETTASATSLRGLLYRLLATDFCNAIHKTCAPLAHFIINDKTKAAHASVFASRWRSDMANYARVADLIKIGDWRATHFFQPIGFPYVILALKSFTADWLDCIAYGLGALYFDRLINK